MTYRLSVACLALFASACAPPPPDTASQQSAAPPANSTCATLARYGGAASGASPFMGAAPLGYAMGASIRALQNLSDCPRDVAGSSGFSGSSGGSSGGSPHGPATAATQPLLAEKTACTARVRTRPEFAPVAGHFGDVASGKFSMVQMTDDTKPTATEARLVAEYYDASLPCVQAMAQAFAKQSPGDATILDQSLAAQQSVVAQLATRRISWGEFAQQSEKISEQAAAKMQTAGL